MFVPIIGIEYSWTQTGFHGICNVHNGEVKLSQSSGQRSSLKACQQACLANSKCRSISYTKKQWCNQYSTSCTSTTFEVGTKSYSLRRPTTPARATAPAPTPAPTTTPATTPATTTPAGTMHCVATDKPCAHLNEHACCHCMYVRAPSRVLTRACTNH